MTDENLKKLQTILIGDDFHAPVKLKDCHKSPTIIVVDDTQPALEINGKKYRKREQKKKSPKIGGFGAFAMMTAMMSPYDISTPSERKRPTVNSQHRKRI